MCAVTGEAIAKALGGRKMGRGWMARCPAHDDRTPSLSIAVGRDRRLLLKCFASCGQDAVIDALRARGLWPGRATGDREFVPEAEGRYREAEAAEERRRVKAAQAIWRASVPAAGTLVEAYLRSRGIELVPPPSLRFAPALRHSPSGLALPAMIAAVQGPDGRIVGVHRTFLKPDGLSKAAVAPVKMALGPIAGGAVRLATWGEQLQVAEGIETALTAMQATAQHTWSALSTSGLKALILPPEVREVVILADGDVAGEQAAQAAARRWLAERRRVRIARPPQGLDFNDMLLGRALAKADEAP